MGNSCVCSPRATRIAQSCCQRTAAPRQGNSAFAVVRSDRNTLQLCGPRLVKLPWQRSSRTTTNMQPMCCHHPQSSASFQRNGVILDQRFWHSEWRHRCCQQRRSSGFSGIFEIVAADKGGG